MNDWALDAIFYQIYPLGACGAPRWNDMVSLPEPRLLALMPWLQHACELGATALYLGPVFESEKHGYDTVDYFRIDRRLGTEDTLAAFVNAAHDAGLHVILDAVFAHVGRSFWAFRDLRDCGASSAYRYWFRGIDFDRPGRFGDSFSYEFWKDAPELPRLELTNPAVCKHLFSAVDQWISRYHIDGLRLDSAEWLDAGFVAKLRSHCRQIKPDFWLVGETVGGDYRAWANSTALHSVTNYEAYKGLWSSHVDRNFFEIAYTLERQFGVSGIYRDITLYNFADNHDVNRVASSVRQRAHLFSLYCLLFSMPGIPSIYAGSEWGITGVRTPTDDYALRPYLNLDDMRHGAQGRDLCDAIRRLAAVRRASNGLRRGGYRQLFVAAEQLAFLRQTEEEAILVAVNAAANMATQTLNIPGCQRAILTDLLNPTARYETTDGKIRIDVPPTWARILKVQKLN